MSIGYETPRGGADVVDSYIRIRAVLQHTILSHNHFFIPKTIGRRLSLVKSEAEISKNPECIRIRDFWCGWRESNPHAHTDTSTSSLPVYQFQHSRKMRPTFESQGLLYLLWLDLSTTFFKPQHFSAVTASRPPHPGLRRGLPCFG